MGNFKTKLKIFLVVGFLFFGLQAVFVLAWSAPLSSPPTCNAGDPGCDVPLNVGSFLQKKKGTLWVNTDNNATGLVVRFGNVSIGTAVVSPGLSLDVSGKVGATEYCDANGLNCTPAASLGGGGGGDITAVNSGTGLTGGGTSGGVTLSADTNYLQRRVTSSCGAGSSIRVINSNGTVTCETDDTGAGGGISGSGSTNYLSKFTGATTLGNSQIYDNGNIGIGRTNPSTKLHVQGGLRVEGNINTSSSGAIYGGSGAINNTFTIGYLTTNSAWLGGSTYVDGNMTVGGTLRANSSLCLSDGCKSRWSDVGGGGAPSVTRRQVSIGGGSGTRSATAYCSSGYPDTQFF